MSRPDAGTEVRSEAGPADQVIPLPLLGAIGFAVTADTRVIAPLLHALAADFGTAVVAAALAALAVSAYTFPYGLFQLVYGPLGDRLGKVRVMAVALLAARFAHLLRSYPASAGPTGPVTAEGST